MFPCAPCPPTSTSVDPSWHDTQEHNTHQSTSKESMVNPRPPPPPLSPIPPFSLCQATTQEETWVPFLNLTLFCIIKKKGKGFAMVHSASCVAACLSGAPCDPETQIESKGESRYPAPHPPHTVEHGGLARPPIHPSSSSCCTPN